MTIRAPIKPVDRVPTLHYSHGKAWRFDLPAIRQRTNLSPEDDAGIDAWLIEAAWAHPVWHSYLLTLIHLRPVRGKPPPIMYVPHATHEMHLQALAPDGDRDRLLAEGSGAHCPVLEPMNFCAQFVEISDDLARDRVRNAVAMVIDGALSPDTDFVRNWADLFGDNMMKERAR